MYIKKQNKNHKMSCFGLESPCTPWHSFFFFRFAVITHWIIYIVILTLTGTTVQTNMRVFCTVVCEFDVCETVDVLPHKDFLQCILV